MITIYRIILFIGLFLLVSASSYVSLQRLNFNNLFKENSTFQIRTLLLFVSCAIGFLIAIGFNELIGLILEL